MMPGEAPEDADWLFGNSLTFNNAISNKFGQTRFNRNEGFYGMVSKRFGLNADKGSFRTIHDAELDTLMIFTTIHALSLERRRRLEAPDQAPVLAAAA